MGFREDAIAVARAAANKEDEHKRELKEARAITIAERESRTKQRGVEAVQNWIRERGANPDECKIVVVDYFYKQGESSYVYIADDSPSYEKWVNGALLTWQVDGDKFVAEFNMHRDTLGTFERPEAKESEQFEVWISLNGRTYIALTEEELGKAYLGRGLRRRYSFQNFDRGWSGLFTVDPLVAC